MFNVKTSMTVAVALVALSALGATSASADWFINGSALTSTAALASQWVVDGDTTLLVPALGLEILCNGATIDGLDAFLKKPNAATARGVFFLACNTKIPASGCPLAKANQTIATLPLNVLASLGPAPSDRLLFTAQTKNLISEIEFSEANTCAFNGVEPVKGAFIITAPNGQTEEVNQAVEGLGAVENNSLEIGAGDKMFLDHGKILMKLANGSKWSFK